MRNRVARAEVDFSSPLPPFPFECALPLLPGVSFVRVLRVLLFPSFVSPSLRRGSGPRRLVEGEENIGDDIGVAFEQELEHLLILMIMMNTTVAIVSLQYHHYHHQIQVMR